MKPSFRHWRYFHAYGGVLLFPFVAVVTVTGWIMVDSVWYGLKNIEIRWFPLVEYYRLTQPKYDPAALVTDEVRYMTFLDGEGRPFDFAHYRGAYYTRMEGGDWIPFDHSPEGGAGTSERHVPKRNRPPTWFNFVLDIHTGVFFARSAEALYEILCAAVVLLSLIGLYLWWIPMRIRRSRWKAAAKRRNRDDPPRVSFRSWRIAHRYLGLAVFAFFAMWAVTGFLLMDEDVYGLREIDIEFYPLRRWYEVFFPEYNFANIEYEPAVTVPLRHPDGYAAEVGYHDGEFVMRKPGRGWEREWASDWGNEVRRARIRRPAEPLESGNLIWDLHTGLFFARSLDWFYEFASLLAGAISAAGVYLWWKPRRKARARRADVSELP